MIEEKHTATDRDSFSSLCEGANFKNSKIIYAGKGHL